MAKVSEFISRLDKAKRVGSGKWMACCPAHNDNSPSLAIREEGDKLLIHCFAGCSPFDVMEAVGMSISDLMPDRPEGDRGAWKPPRFSRHELFNLVCYEALVIHTQLYRLRCGAVLGEEEVERLDMAMDIIASASNEVGGLCG